jgi:hypothetical protein
MRLASRHGRMKVSREGKEYFHRLHSAPDYEPAELGTISISNSSRVSEVHGNHTLAPTEHATELT